MVKTCTTSLPSPPKFCIISGLLAAISSIVVAAVAATEGVFFNVLNVFNASTACLPELNNVLPVDSVSNKPLPSPPLSTTAGAKALTVSRGMLN